MEAEFIISLEKLRQWFAQGHTESQWQAWEKIESKQ